MAAWLAYLKSQLLLPPAERELDDAEAVAEDLGERLRRLEALRQAAESLQARPRLGERAVRSRVRRSGTRSWCNHFGWPAWPSYWAAMAA